MVVKQQDTRDSERRKKDEEIAAEAPRPIPDLPADAKPRPVEDFLSRRRPRPVAVAGVVENGLVRPLDPQVKLTEHSRVIIVATDSVAP
jgi:hypothetical protein